MMARITLKTDTQGQKINVDLGYSDAELVAAKTLILYGDSGLGKSSQLATAAEWLYEQHRKPIRLVSAEDSSKTIFEPLILAGIVEPLFITKSVNPVSTLRRLSRGEWYVGDKWQEPDGNYCAYIIEGLQSIAEQLQEDCREKGRFLGEQKESAVMEDGIMVALPGRFSYNFVQLEMLRLIKSFAMIPGIVRVLWSGHETKGVEEGTNTQIRGPALVGTAKTASVQKYCGALLHLDGYSQIMGRGQEATVQIKRRIWFDRHPDPQLPVVQYPAKITLPPVAVPFFRKRFKESYFDSVLTEDGRLTPNLADFLQAEKDAVQEATKFYRDKYTNITKEGERNDRNTADNQN